jgi:hypothetical protein
MKLRLIKVIVYGVLLIGFNSSDNWRTLFNGKNIDGWDTYLGPLYDSIQHDFTGQPIGLNKDPNRVFTVVKEDGKSAIRFSGENFGGISTKEEFENYHLQLQFKWGKLKSQPRKKDKRDSGLLYHAVGPHGADWKFWMRSQEFQIQEGDCGDYWGVAGGVFDVHATKQNEKEYVFNAAGPLQTFSEKSPVGRRCIKNPDAEKSTGQWNTLDLYCYKGTSVHVVNNVVTMVLYNSRQLDGEKESPLVKGKIQLQSEGAEIYFSNIQIQQITKIPEGLLK